MEIEIRLREILEGLDLQGVSPITAITEYTKIHRHTVSKLLRGEYAELKADQWGLLCDWLIESGATGLPGALFGKRASGLWRALGDRERIRFVLAAYQSSRLGVRHRWISLDDFLAARQLTNAIADFLRRGTTPRSAEQGIGATTPQKSTLPPFVFEYLSLNLVDGGETIGPGDFQGDVEEAERRFREIQQEKGSESIILIGSQRANYLTELAVADLYGVQPFRSVPPNRKRIHVPFSMISGRGDRQVASCFANESPPLSYSGVQVPGIYYINAKGTWECIPWKRDRDIGVLIFLRKPGTNRIQLILFGFKAPGTSAMAAELVKNEAVYWQSFIAESTKTFGVYLCEFRFDADVDESPDTSAKLIRRLGLAEGRMDRFREMDVPKAAH